MPVQFPLDFLTSWHFQKIESLYGKRLGDCCLRTILAMYKQAADSRAPAGAMSVRLARRLVHACNPRDKRRVLWALTQANVLRRTPGGYSIWALAPEPGRVVSEQPRSQLNLALEQPSAGRTRLLSQEEATAAVEKAEQNHADSLARACDMSAPQGDDAPLIDPASTHTEVLQATAGALAPSGLVLPLGSASENPIGGPDLRDRTHQRLGGRPISSVPTRVHGGPDRECGAHPGEQRTGLGPLAVVLERILPDRAKVVRGIEPPRRFIDRHELTRPVNTRRVIKQQKVVRCRKPSSTAVLLHRLEGDLTPTLYPTTEEIVAETARVWPNSPLGRGKAEQIMLQQATWDEVREGIKKVEAGMERGEYHSPAVLFYVIDGARKGKQGTGPGRKPALRVAPTPDGGDKTVLRKLIVAEVNGHLGPELRPHWLTDNMSAILHLKGKTPDEVVSLYVEMMGENPDVLWREVCEAAGEGRRPDRTGLLPPPNDPSGSPMADCMKLVAGIR